jgi:hypothetical protein
MLAPRLLFRTEIGLTFKESAHQQRLEGSKVLQEVPHRHEHGPHRQQASRSLPLIDPNDGRVLRDRIPDLGEGDQHSEPSHTWDPCARPPGIT